MFGVSMEQLMERLEMNGCTTQKIPPILEEVINHLEQKALLVSGIFRISGSKKRLETLKQQYDAGNIVNLNDYTVHDIAGILKLYLRELPEPIIPSRLTKLLTDVGSSKKISLTVFFRSGRFDVEFQAVPNDFVHIAECT